MKRVIVVIMIALLVAGCSIRSKSYYLLDGNKEVKSLAKLSGSVGIETITLPRYFNQSSVAMKEGHNRVVFLPHANWVSNMDEHLTGVLISYLKRYFNATDIYLFPWDVSKKIERKVAIKIENFIYEKGEIHLDASWEIAKDGQKIAKFFHISVPSKSDSEKIVKHMDEAFSALQVAIAKSLFSPKKLL